MHFEDVARLPLQTPWIEVIHLEEQAKSVAFGLAANGSLYANDRLLIKNFTSFLITAAHLIFTTTQHLIKFVHLTHVQGKFCAL